MQPFGFDMTSVVALAVSVAVVINDVGAHPVNSPLNFRCRPGEALVGYSSFFVAERNERHFYDYKCTPVPGKPQNEKCDEVIWTPNTEMLRCSNGGYVAGIQAENGPGLKAYRYLCCMNEAATYLEESCHDFDAGGRLRFGELSLCTGEAIRGVKTMAGNHSDDAFYFEVCSFNGKHLLRADAYKRHSVRQTQLFGNASQSYKCGTGCDLRMGHAITRLDSMWSDANTDRAFDAECGRASKTPLKCSKVRYVSPDGIPHRDGTMLEPVDWALTACVGEEMLTSITSEYIDGVRRYTFGCCVLATRALKEGTCLWRPASGHKSYVVEPPAGWVLRGVSAVFEGRHRDRAMRFEMCQLREFSNKPQCGLAARTLEGKATLEMSHVFHLKRVDNAQGCAQACHRHPFCVTAGYSAPSATKENALGNTKGTCFLSYKRDKRTCPTELKQSIDTTKPVWIYCIVCSNEPAAA